MLNARKTARKLWLGALASVLLLAGGSAQAQIADGLVAYWNFDGDNYLDLIGGFDGTPEGSVPIPFVDGQAGFGKAIKLNGEDQEVLITGGEPDDLAFAGGSMTVSAWFKVDAFDTAWQALVAKGEGTNWRVHRRDQTTFMTSSLGLGEPAQGGPAINDGQWHHVAAIADNTDPGGMFLYIDGVLAESTTTLPVLAANGQRVRIGENPGALGREWEGEIDDVAIWSRPLTADEVTLLANASLSSLLGGVDRIIVRSPTANAESFLVQALDIGTAVVDPATVTTVLDGVSVTPTVSKLGQTTTITYSIFADQNTFFASGSQHTLVVNLNDTQGNPVVAERTFTVAPYATIPASYALAAPPTVPGMVVSRVFQTASVRTPSAAANNTASAEQQLLGGMVDLAGTVLPNIAENPGPINIGGDSDGGLYWTANANWEQNGGDINPNPPQPDNFNSIEPAGSGGLYGNEYPPGPLLSEDPNNYVVETIAYVNLTRGLHRWGVNSDEGFKVTAAPGQPSVLGVTLGEFSGTRAAADTIFDFVVEADGHYPVRLLSWEGNNADASCEWFSVDIETGEKVLIGDVNNSASYDAFRTGQGRARVSSILPAPGYTGVVPQPTIRIEIVNGRTSYVAGSAKLSLDGVAVTPTVQGTVITYAVPTQLARDTTHTVELIWEESTTPVTSWTNSWSFTIASFTPDTFPPAPDSFWIEAEDFDYNRGQTVAAASTMPYTGGAYNGLIAVLDVDYFDTETSFPFDDAGTGYRGSTRDNPATMIRSTLSSVMGTEQFATSRPGGVTMTSNYKIGWVGGDNWWNYTRNIPAGTYRAYSAQSQGGPTDIVRSTLYWVTSGAGQTNNQQVLQTLGVFRSIGSPGWSQNILCPLRTADAADAPLAAFKLPGGPVTLRWQGLGGDHDWMVLVKDTSVPASVKSLSPAEGSIQYRDAEIQVVLEDFGTKVDPATIKLTVNGADVTAQATINKVGDLTTVTYDPGLLAADATQTYTIEFKDDGSPVKTSTATATFTTHLYPGVPAGTFAVEAEDFDHGGGQVAAAANTMPYVGGAYDQLVPLLGIDYQDNGTETDAGIVYYRTDLRPNNPNMNNNLGGRLGTDRGNWTVTTSYKIGWTGVGDWYNYTRTMPAGAYEVYVAISHDSATTGNENSRASLDRVTSGVGTATQTLAPLGVFRAPGSGGWGQNRLVPLTAAVDNPQKVVVSVSGPATFRLNADSGDLDYLLFLPTGAPPQPEISSIVINPNGSVTVTWAGSAVLEAAPAVTGPWTEVAGATSPYTFDPTESMLFGRLRQ